MGAAKHEMMRYETERWSETDDGRRVCQQCFNDNGIKSFIRSHANEVGCDFCFDISAENRKAIDVDKVISFIADCINREYCSPEGVLPWDSEEGHYFFHSQISGTEELLRDLIESDNDELIDLVVSAFDETAEWVHTDVLNDSPKEIMASLWGSFAEIVKHERRFFFPRPNKNSVARISQKGPRTSSEILTAISDVSKKAKLFRYVSPGEPIYRARKFFHSEGISLNLENLGVPDKMTSKKFANRMSPAGIPIYYGSNDPKAAFQEVQYTNGDTVAISKYIVNRKLLVLDLTLIPSPPSIFEEHNWLLRDSISFLNHFRREIMKPVDRTKGDEHVDYVPSQVFTEFLRYRVKINSENIDGVIFPSTHETTKKNYALFCDNSLILEGNNISKKHFLKYVGLLKLKRNPTKF